MAFNDYIIDGLTENAVMANPNYIPKTIVDNDLEFVDPTPNVHTLFVQFNRKFFKNALDCVEVKWSKRMTSCAGTCTFQPRNRACYITLSEPLLKLRPRKDLVETLLHEMIHGYLFIKNGAEDRDGHGPKFQEHMNRINKEAGTNITIYHDFHDEVKLYQQHWWRCNGPCHKKPPYYGMVRRASNRAPSANDFWWARHQMECGGEFIKIKEPDSYKTKKLKSNNKIQSKPVTNSNGTLSKWLGKPNNVSVSKNSEFSKIKSATMTSKGSSSNSSNQSRNSEIKKLGNSTNSVHGFGVGGPNSKSSPSTFVGSSSSSDGWKKDISTSGPKFSCVGTLGGSNSGRSNLLDKYGHTNSQQAILNVRSSNIQITAPKNEKNKNVSDGNRILMDTFLKNSGKSAVIDSQNADLKNVQCPVCNKVVAERKINEHLDLCLKTESGTSSGSETFINDNNSNCLNNENIFDDFHEKPNSSGKRKSDVIIIEEFPPPNLGSNPSQKCLVCNCVIDANLTLDQHLEICIGGLFDDDMIDGEKERVPDKSSKNVNLAKQTYPCPVCLTMIENDQMNNHLDSCLR